MTVSMRQLVNRILVTVEITNTGAGHHVPADFPGRHLILTVTAADSQGQSLANIDGPVVQDWGGGQAGMPGQAFAKVLQDVASGESPVVNYWKQTLIVDDNRIPALGTDVSHYTFVLPSEPGEIDVKARLLFRRLFQPLADQKEWQTPDLLMEEVAVVLAPQPLFDSYLPTISSP
jgi:hypothetical protein